MHSHNFVLASYSDGWRGAKIGGVMFLPKASYSTWVCLCGQKKNIEHENNWFKDEE